jgi:hypothetical protein
MIQDPLEPFVLPSISNGNPREQALIRKWWREQHGSRGILVWEYFLEGRYLDALWFLNDEVVGVEECGASASRRFPLAGRNVALCEAKIHLNPELVGQALVYRQFALKAGALVQQVYAFSEFADPPMFRSACELGLEPVVLRLNAG